MLWSVREFEFGVGAVMVHVLLPQQSGAEVLQLIVWCRDERELDHIFSSDEWMTQRLQWRQPLPRIDLQYLLHEVYELVDLEPISTTVFKVEGDEVTLTLRSSCPLLCLMKIMLLLLELGHVVRFKKLREVVVLVVVHRLLDSALEFRRHHRDDELIESLEHVVLLLWIEEEEAIAVLRVLYHLQGGLAAEFEYLEQLIIVVLAWEDRNLDEELDGCAGQRPHVDALVVQRYGLRLSFSVEYICWLELLAAHQNLGGSVVARLDISVDLVAVERSASEVNELHVDAVVCDQNVLRFEIAMDHVGLLAGDQRLQDLPGIVSDDVQTQTALRLLYDIIERLGQQLKYNAEIISEYKVILHFNQVLLLELSSVRTVIELLQNLSLDDALENVFGLVLDNFDSVL